ncbi:hypothetical protein ACFW04_010506 [Cataglyphis niger]
MSNQCPVDYNKCMYKECKNAKFSHGKRLFRFPMQKDARCNIWICNTGESLCNNYKIGMCEDHFSATSFTNATKIRLTRDAVPIAYNDVGTSVNKRNIEVEEMSKCTTVFPNDENKMLKEQMLQECTLRTYRPAILNFEMSAEQEDIMEWTVENCMSDNNVAIIDDDVDDDTSITDMLNKHVDILKEYDVDTDNRCDIVTTSMLPMIAVLGPQLSICKYTSKAVNQ